MPRRTVRPLATLAAAACLLAGLATTPAHAADAVRIGQATSAVSFLPLWSARALDTFGAENLTPTVNVVPGGDPTALAALDAGDIDLAAVGSEAPLRAAAKGQPFQIVYSLMSKNTLQLVVSKAFLERTGVKASDPLPKRLAALKGALIGVSSVGGAQDTASRWLAGKGGLDPKTDVKIAQIGNPPALRAALENGRIDAFALSPPEGYLVEKSGAGAVLVNFGDEFPLLADQPFLVLVAKTPVDPAKADLIRRTVRALQAASRKTVADPTGTAKLIGEKFFAKAEPDSIVAAVEAMKSGVASGGRLDATGFGNLLTFAREVGTDFGAAIDAKSSDGKLWSNSYVEAAGK